jgi:Ca2+-binding RTX toxin-like protein
VLAGGSGLDRFDFNTLLDSVKGANRDVISLFSRSDHDRIDLSTIDANRAVAGNQAFHVIGAQPFHDIAGEVRFAGGILQGDVNGDGISDFEIKVPGVNTLVAADLVL